MEEIIKSQLGQTLREYISARSDYRNQLLYATDGYTVTMNESLSDLIEIFRTSLRDLLWVLALLLGGKPISKNWGLVSQFIGVYREILVRAKALKRDGSVETPIEAT